MFSNTPLFLISIFPVSQTIFILYMLPLLSCISIIIFLIYWFHSIIFSHSVLISKFLVAIISYYLTEIFKVFFIDVVKL